MKSQIHKSSEIKVIQPVLAHIYQEMGQSSELLLKNYALDFSLSKFQKYDAEMKLFKKKYDCSFKNFKKKVAVMENDENIEWEDDLKDWEFAEEKFRLWRTKIRDLKSVLID